jgi:hypothetical protein
MSNYTQGPWKLYRNDQSVGDANGFAVCDVWPRGDDGMASEEGKANARRIVACVNALQGVPTEELERHHLGHAGEVQFRIEMTKQRDELFAALEGLLSDGCVVMNCGNGALHAARIAIAKAKGGAA